MDSLYCNFIHMIVPYIHLSFDWDENKNQTNIKKHGVPFEEAQFAFGDPDRIII